VGLVSDGFLAYTSHLKFQGTNGQLWVFVGKQFGQIKTGGINPMSQTSDDRLDSWKEIAAYLGRDIRTVRRWEADRGLPIHRVPGGGRPVVFAFRGEIQTWLRASEEESHRRAGRNGNVAAEGQAQRSVLGSDGQLPAAAAEALPAQAPAASVISAAVTPPASARQGPLRPVANLRFPVLIGILVVVGAVTVLLVPRSRLAFTPPARDADKVPVILAVNSIVPQPRQRIVIQGKGFGLHVPYSHTDSPYLAIRDLTAQWAAGRIIPQNWDEVTLDVESWTDDQIVVNGFSGSYGPNGWTLSFADKLEIAVWNPQSGSGPALYHVAVVSADARR
jgi:hypothetical protein